MTDAITQEPKTESPVVGESLSSGVGWVEHVVETPAGPFTYRASYAEQKVVWKGNGGGGEMEFGTRARPIPDIPGTAQHFRNYREAYEKYVKTVGQQPSRIFDCACSVGYGGAILAAWAGMKKGKPCEWWGVDLDEASIAYAKHRYPQGKFSVGDVRDLKDIPSGYFDLYVCSDTFEYIPVADTVHLLREAHRVLRPGGLLFLSTPNQRPIMRWSPHHEWEYELWEFQNILTWFAGRLTAAEIHGHGERPKCDFETGEAILSEEGKPIPEDNVFFAYLWKMA